MLCQSSHQWNKFLLRNLRSTCEQWTLTKALCFFPRKFSVECHNEDTLNNEIRCSNELGENVHCVRRIIYWNNLSFLSKLQWKILEEEISFLLFRTSKENFVTNRNELMIERKFYLFVEKKKICFQIFSWNSIHSIRNFSSKINHTLEKWFYHRDEVNFVVDMHKKHLQWTDVFLFAKRRTIRLHRSNSIDKDSIVARERLNNLLIGQIDFTFSSLCGESLNSEIISTK